MGSYVYPFFNVTEGNFYRKFTCGPQIYVHWDWEFVLIENVVLRVFLSITFNTLFFGTCQNVLIEVLIESVLIEMEDLANSLTHRIITPF